LQTGSQFGKCHSLWRWVLDELDTLADVTLEASIASLEELLLVCVGLADNVLGLLGAVGLSCVRSL